MPFRILITEASLQRYFKALSNSCFVIGVNDSNAQSQSYDNDAQNELKIAQELEAFLFAFLSQLGTHWLKNLVSLVKQAKQSASNLLDEQHSETQVIDSFDIDATERKRIKIHILQVYLQRLDNLQEFLLQKIDDNTNSKATSEYFECSYAFFKHFESYFENVSEEAHHFFEDFTFEEPGLVSKVSCSSTSGSAFSSKLAHLTQRLKALGMSTSTSSSSTSSSFSPQFDSASSSTFVSKDEQKPLLSKRAQNRNTPT